MNANDGILRFMGNLRLSLLVKLAIIFLAVMVVPAAIVAVYVKQQFDDINLQNRMANLEYGRTSLLALLDEEWRSLFAFSRAVGDSGDFLIESLTREDRILGEGRGVFIAQRDGASLYDSSFECCPPEAVLPVFFPEPEDLPEYLNSEGPSLQRISFDDGRIVLMNGFRRQRSSEEPDFVLVQSSVDSYVFDALRRVSGMKTSIYSVRTAELLGSPPERLTVPVFFSTAINEYAERIESISLPPEAMRNFGEFLTQSDSEAGQDSRLFFDAEFIATLENAERQELSGYLPLLQTRDELLLAQVSIPRQELGAPEEIEYLWVIISALFILVLLMSLLITMYVVAPIINLNQGVENLRKSIGSERGFDELPVHSNDEIGDLAGSFNLLARELTVSLDKIRQQRREILEYAQNLEDKVRERTQEAEAARVRAEMANVHKSKFLVNMNHEFRTPLNSISGITDLLSYGAYDKNDDMAVLLEELSEKLGDKAPAELAGIRDFLFEDSNAMYYLHRKLADSMESKNLNKQEMEETRAVMAKLEALIGEEERGKLKAYRNISEAGKTLIHIVDDVINLSRIESGSIDIHPEECSLSEIINYAMVHGESYCRAKGKTALLELSRQIASDVPERIVVDHYRVKQILMNFLSNAVKYSDSGTVELAVEVVIRRNRELLRFSVRDQGIGIDPAEHHLIFREFGRTFNVRDIEGTGLGLAISRKLVEAQGGEAGFTSSPGDGSEFWFVLPLTRPGEEAEEAVDEKPETSGNADEAGAGKTPDSNPEAVTHPAPASSRVSRQRNTDSQS